MQDYKMQMRACSLIVSCRSMDSFKAATLHVMLIARVAGMADNIIIVTFIGTLFFPTLSTFKFSVQYTKK